MADGDIVMEGRHQRRLSLVTGSIPPQPPDAVQSAVLCRNLSYVLHEASTSPNVSRFARTILQQFVRARRAARALAGERDEDLLPRIVLRDERAVWAFQRASTTHVLTYAIGATSLLPRVLHLIRPRSAPPITLWWLDRPHDRCPVRIPLFRGTATLSLPPTEGMPQWFAILVFRPGWRSVLLDLVELVGDDALLSLTSTLERTLRDYTDQWWCWRPWWDRPAELVLPELRESL
ncbi:MAG: hypothetical protein NZ696_01620 [Thermomicrobium sp.]|nr:hypothetical protein [Thermomicrobium sp.]MDW7982253.1 hypothetical protein [Thermomicrobium sp.]